MKAGFYTTMLAAKNRGEPAARLRKLAPLAKLELHPKKVLNIWWDFKNMIYELLRPNKTINTAKYSFQLDKLKVALHGNALTWNCLLPS